MASTYTTNTGIELIATGEQSGTWGDTTNVNLQIIDRLTNGVGAITLSGTTHTLTTTDGVLSDGQYAVLVLGGTPSGTNTVTISPNDQQKVYFVKNSSGQSVILTQGSGGNVTLADGSSAVVYADGAGAGAAVVDITATLSGNLLAANNLSDVASAPTARINLGVAIGSDVLAYDANLQGFINAFTLPTSDGTSGQALVTNGAGTLSLGDVVGGIGYVTKTANYTASSNEGVLADTSGGAFTVTLPATPSAGDQVVIADSGEAFDTNNLTVGRNGETIEGTAEDLILDIVGVSVQLVYDGTTWQVYAQVGGAGGDVVTLNDPQTISQKNLKDYSIEGSAIGNTGATQTFDLEVANFFSATLDQNSTFTFSNPAASGDFCGFVLELTNGGAFTITFPASVDWVGGTAPTLTAAGVDLLVFVTRDGGTTFLGLVAGLDIK